MNRGIISFESVGPIRFGMMISEVETEWGPDPGAERIQRQYCQ